MADYGEIHLLRVDQNIPVLQQQIETLNEKLITQADTIVELDASKTKLTRELTIATTTSTHLQAQVVGAVGVFQQLQAALATAKDQLRLTKDALGTSNEELTQLREAAASVSKVAGSTAAVGQGPLAQSAGALYAKVQELSEAKAKVAEMEITVRQVNAQLADLKNGSRLGQVETELLACKKQIASMKAEKERRDKADAARAEALRMGGAP